MARRRRVSRAKLIRDLFQLRLDCQAPHGMAVLLLDAFVDREISPHLPELHGVFQPLLTPEEGVFLKDPANRCRHAYGGDEPAADEPEVSPALPPLGRVG